jgi:ABC-2 type transport system permease protein
VLAAVLGVGLSMNPLHLLGVVALVVLGAAFFSCLSMSIAGLVLSRERVMGVGQAIMMPLFFASNALYPTELMPAWLQTFSRVNPLSYEVDGLRGLLVGTASHVAVDLLVLTGCAAAAIAASFALLGRLTR